MPSACLLYGDQEHYLDHLVPICDLLDIPLVITEERIALLTERFYPHIPIRLLDPLSFPEKVISSYDLVFSCLPQKMSDQLFLITELLHRKKLKKIWVPHGNSDKGHHSHFMENLRDEEHLLVYGQKMIDFLHEKGVFEKPKQTLAIGNYRKLYFQRHRAFYQHILPASTKPTLLYAPTWNDCEGNSSLLSILPSLLNLSYNVIVKLHPNQLKQLGDELAVLKKHPSLFLLESFPPIYPLLSHVDLYLGDYSSIGYDFLTENKPMFFLNHKKRSSNDPSNFLFKAGHLIEPEFFSSLNEVIGKNSSLELTKKRKEIENYTFAPIQHWEQTKELLNDFVKQIYIGSYVEH